MKNNIENKSRAEAIAELVHDIEIEPINRHYSRLKLSAIIKEIHQSEDAVILNSELLADVIKSSVLFGKNSQETDEMIADLEWLIAQSPEAELNYESFLSDRETINNHKKCQWLVGKVDKISNKLAQDIIQHYDETDALELIQEVINKSPELVLFPFVKEIYDDKVLSWLLQRIDEVTDPEIAQHFLILAVFKSNEELISQIETKSPTVALDYNAVLGRSVDSIGKSLGKNIKHDGNLRILTHLLEKGVDVNCLVTGNTYSGNLSLPISLAFGAPQEHQMAIVEKLLEYGAKISLAERYQQYQIVDHLRKTSAHQQLKNYLAESETAVKRVVESAIREDDAKILEVLNIDVRQKFQLADFSYKAVGDDVPQSLLVHAVKLYKVNIAVSLAKAKVADDGYPVVAEAVIIGNNELLKTLCENGYNLNAPISHHVYTPQGYVKTMAHPLEIAASKSKLGSVQILANHLTKDDLRNLSNPAQILRNIINVDRTQTQQNHDTKTAAENLALLLINKGLEVTDQEVAPLAKLACEKGMVNLVKYFVTKGFDLNTRDDLYRENDALSSPIRTAIAGGHDQLTEYLLDQLVTIDEDLLLHAIDRGIRNDLIVVIIDRTANIDFCSHNKENALHIAAKKGNKEIFSLLIEKNINREQLDYRGNDAYHNALYHKTNKKLEISDNVFPFPLAAFDDILEFVAEANKNSDDVTKGECAAKMACLFDNKQQVQSYLRKFSNTSDSNAKALHDLTIFNFPKSNCDRKEWQELAMEHGLELTKYLFLAQAIHEKLERAPESFDEIKATAKLIKYNRAADFPELADLFYENTIAEKNFEMVLKTYQEKPQDHIPDVYVEGAELGHDRFYMKKLAKNDLRGFILGNKTNCCQYIGAEGNDCAMHGMTSPFAGFYVVFKREKQGRVENLNRWLTDLEEAESAPEFLKKFQEKATRNKYDEIIKKTAAELKDKNAAEVNFDEIKAVLKKDFQKELEGEIVAQSWVWLSKNNHLVLDSWERLRPEDDILFKPFMKKMAEEILQNNHNQISKVMIGCGGNTPNQNVFHGVANPEIPQDYKGYRDSVDQYLIAQRTNEVIAFNPIFEIDDKRLNQLHDSFSIYTSDGQNNENGRKNLEVLQTVQRSWREKIQNKKSATADASNYR